MGTVVFLLVVMMVNGAYLGWYWWDARRQRFQLHRRLALEPVRPEREKSKLIELDAKGGAGVLERSLAAIGVGRRLEALLEQAGDRAGVGGLVRRTVLWGVASCLAGMTLLPFGRALGALLLGGPVAILPYVLLRRAAGKRLARFEEQFPSCLEFVSRSMRAGHGFSVAMELIGGEFEEPLAGEFKRVHEEHSLGMPLEGALRKLAGRVPLLSVQFFVCAVTLQKRTGGNLAEVLDKLAGIIRERFKLKQRVKVISAHGKMTATALTLIPACVAGLMWLSNPRYMKFFVQEGTGPWLALAAVMLQGIGYAIISRMVRIEA